MSVLHRFDEGIKRFLSVEKTLMEMEQQEPKNPLAENRSHLTQLLVKKSALKQDIAKDSELVFKELVSSIKEELNALRELVPDERVRLC
jgi:ribosomal protein L23